MAEIPQVNGFLTKFQGVASIAGVLFIMVATVAGLGYSSLSNRVGFTEEHLISKEQFGEYSKRIDDRLGVADRTIANVADEQRRRTGNVQQVTALEKRIDGLVLRVIELEKAFGSSYTLNDAIKDLKDDVKILRAKLLAPVGDK